MIGREGRAYLNRQTGEVVHLNEFESEMDLDELELDSGEELADWQKEVLRTNEDIQSSDDYMLLPTSTKIDEYGMLNAYCQLAAPESKRDYLLDQICGAGAFRRFRSAVRRLGLEDEWYEFRDQQYKLVARNWLDEQGLEYSEE